MYRCNTRAFREQWRNRAKRERQSVNKDAADTERRTNHDSLQQFTVQQTPGARTTTVFLMIVQANVVTY